MAAVQNFLSKGLGAKRSSDATARDNPGYKPPLERRDSGNSVQVGQRTAAPAPVPPAAPAVSPVQTMAAPPAATWQTLTTGLDDTEPPRSQDTRYKLFNHRDVYDNVIELEDARDNATGKPRTVIFAEDRVLLVTTNFQISEVLSYALISNLSLLEDAQVLTVVLSRSRPPTYEVELEPYHLRSKMFKDMSAKLSARIHRFRVEAQKQQEASAGASSGGAPPPLAVVSSKEPFRRNTRPQITSAALVAAAYSSSALPPPPAVTPAAPKQAAPISITSLPPPPIMPVPGSPVPPPIASSGGTSASSGGTSLPPPAAAPAGKEPAQRGSFPKQQAASHASGSSANPFSNLPPPPAAPGAAAPATTVPPLNVTAAAASPSTGPPTPGSRGGSGSGGAAANPPAPVATSNPNSARGAGGATASPAAVGGGGFQRGVVNRTNSPLATHATNAGSNSPSQASPLSSLAAPAPSLAPDSSPRSTEPSSSPPSSSSSTSSPHRDGFGLAEEPVLPRPSPGPAIPLHLGGGQAPKGFDNLLSKRRSIVVPPASGALDLAFASYLDANCDRLVPTKESLERVVAAMGFSPAVPRFLEQKLLDETSWLVRLKTLFVVEGYVLYAADAAKGRIVWEHFLTQGDRALRAAITAQQSSIREKAVKLTQLLQKTAAPPA